MNKLRVGWITVAGSGENGHHAVRLAGVTPETTRPLDYRIEVLLRWLRWQIRRLG